MKHISKLFQEYHSEVFKKYGATPKGVDWNDDQELLFRYKKMMAVLDKDFYTPAGRPTVLDVGCGWGGLYQYCRNNGMDIDYTGVDIVADMVDYANANFPSARFINADVFTHDFGRKFDFVICNAIMTQKLNLTIPEMEAFCDNLVTRMYELCIQGIVFNFMSTRVNFMVDNLYYRSPVELLNFCLTKLSPRVKLDHGYSSLASGRGKYYDYTVYLYRD